MIEKKNEIVRLKGQDMVLGGLLAREIPGGLNMTDCPTTVTLAEFIDGTLSPDAREGVAAHLGGCELCFSTLSESLAIREELGNRSRARRKKYLYYSIPASLAAAAVLLLVFRVLQPAPEFIGKSDRQPAHREAMIEKKPLLKPDVAAVPRSFANELTISLAADGNAVLHALIAGNHAKPVGAFGFSSIVPLEKTAFRIGACLTDLEVALKAKDKDSIELFAKKLADLLKPLESSHGPIPIPGLRGGRGGAIKEASRYDGFSNDVEALFNNKKEGVYVNFGEWVEAAALAADIRDAAFFQPAVVRHFKQELEMSGVPVGTLRNLSELEAIPSSGGSPEEQFRIRARLLADIKEMF